MKKEHKEILREFQTEQQRLIEEQFAQILSESENVRVFFINENRAFTDGQNIVVDPGVGDVFCQRTALERAEEIMGLPREISRDPWHALSVITRGQVIHEALHVLLTEFPVRAFSDPRSNTKVRGNTLALISNIIEDAYIEAVGCSVFDNLSFFLTFERLATFFSESEMDSTAQEMLSLPNSIGSKPNPGEAEHGDAENEGTESYKTKCLIEYLDHMAMFLLYPMFYPMNMYKSPSLEIQHYVEQTKSLFREGSMAEESEMRHTYAQKIFDIIEPLIPDGDEEIVSPRLKRLLYGNKTHSGDAATITRSPRRGKALKPEYAVFSWFDASHKGDHNKEHSLRHDTKEAFQKQLESWLEESETQRRIAKKNRIASIADIKTFSGSEYDCSSVHKQFEIAEKRPIPNHNLRVAYQNIYETYKVNILAHCRKTEQLLMARVPVREERRLFGTGISSRHLADTGRRFWYRNEEGDRLPELAVLIMIDGSGSMEGARRTNAVQSCVILHEVLKKQGIAHAIVEHRAIMGAQKLQHNILVDFRGRDEEKYNLLKISSSDGTREGLSLYWAERYIRSKTTVENRLIIAVSDGAPYHFVSIRDVYHPPFSLEDTRVAVQKIMKRGTNVLAVALDSEDGDCSLALRQIYPSVVSCTDLSKLTLQLLGMITRFYL